MIYLAKSATDHGVVNLDPGLPPWRPITVQSALSSRIFTVIRDYISPCIPNEELQHGFQGFQRDRTVQDAAVLTSLLIERGERRQEELFLISKDCLKCFDRIPGWAMEYIYRKLGVPSLPHQLMAHFLGASQIDIHTAFGWLDGGIREFGIGQGSILAVMHIGYYMDVLIRQQQGGTDPVQISHSQHPQGPRTRTISSLLFVDDALDISTSYSGIQDRVRISNQFTGQSASGGVFGADKSFLLYLSPHAYPAVALNDGLGNPQPIRVVATSEGFRVLYRTAISDAISIALALDILFRKTARRVLRLPHDYPNFWFYDHTDGLGLQTESGLTDHPLAFRIPPPTSDTMFLGTLLRDLATFNPAVTITTQWQQPHASRPQRPNDRPIWAHLTPALSTTLISINRSHANKVRWVGDISNEKGTMLLSLPSLCTKHGWNRATLQRFTPIWDAIPTVTPHNPPPLLRQQTIQWGSQYSGQPLSLSPLPTPPRPHLPYLEQPLGRTFFTPSRSVEAIHVPLHAMLIVPHHLIHWDGRPDTLSYRIGRRTSLQTRHTPAGPEIAVTFWHELRKGTDIWYSPTPREARSRLRLVPIAGCAILTGDLLRTSSTQRHKFIPWTDTTPSSHPHTTLPHTPHACSACHRIADTTVCMDCGQWHHPACIPHCQVALRHSTLTYGLHTLPLRAARTHSVGDGSVTTKENRQPMAHGASWAEMALPLLGIFGYTQTTSPTRCEVLSLLASLHHSGDTALQIYDNTTAIGLVILVRSLKRRGGQPRYSNIHRVELRSLMALLNPEGTFAGDWIRAHQDSTSTPDSVLRAKQALLAEADSLATLAHQLLPHTNYAHLIFPDSWELRDHQDHPVTGATAPWLGAIYSRHNWHAAQARKPDARRTIQPLRLNTGELCKWDLPALSFYWRTICYTLHTNVRKHRIQPRHMQTAHWFVVPEGSPGHTQANSLQITWLLTIPTGQITIRNPSSIHHVSTPQWGKITSSNPVPIHIGFLTTGTTPDLLTPAQHH
ncbi:hypothetical protein B5M09_011381 [Aphanomyces astaci]|uniref:Reverse transcriptase domain-containing protein n=1 Tax=Aphanomyces astaci TaxID=112090 RepID=A0A3R7Y6P7_APHAT|nr:hypothetical protein B5M09_011381 [Aphanomyces astaci]